MDRIKPLQLPPVEPAKAVVNAFTRPGQLGLLSDWYRTAFGHAADIQVGELDASNWAPEVVEEQPPEPPEDLGPKREAAALVIQRTYRGFRDRKLYQRTLVAIMTIQSHIRNHQAGKRRDYAQSPRLRRLTVGIICLRWLRSSNKAKADKEKFPMPKLDAALLDLKAKSVDLKHVIVGNRGVLRLALGIKQFFLLEQLDLTSNYLGSAGLPFVVRALSGKNTLKSLGLSWNAINDDAVEYFAGFFKTFPGLETLDLSHNRITASGAALMAKHMKALSALSLLDLQDNNIAQPGVKALFKASVRAKPGTKTKVINVVLEMNGHDPAVLKEWWQTYVEDAVAEEAKATVRKKPQLSK